MPQTSEQAIADGKKGGRPTGPSPGELTKISRKKAQELCAKNRSPLDVMIDNMNFWWDTAKTVGDEIERKLAESSQLSPEIVEDLKKMLGDFVAWRDKAQACAQAAAPYCHPRYSALIVRDDSADQPLVKFTAKIGPSQSRTRIGIVVDSNPHDAISIEDSSTHPVG